MKKTNNPLIEEMIQKQQTAKNPSYDKALSPEKRLRDFLGAYHITLNGVVKHDPFMLTYEGKPNERCDTEDKMRLIEFVNRLISDQAEKLIEDTRKQIPCCGHPCCCNLGKQTK